MTARFVSPDEIRAAFSAAMSAMYRVEVPLYGALIDIVETINAACLADPAHIETMGNRGDVDRLGGERHGAIRIGTADELAMLRRAFAVMGMYPVGYYDLAPAGVPVHSTAFRPIDSPSLSRNPFRVFTSLLRLDLIEDVDLRQAAAEILAARTIVSSTAVALIARSEAEGGLDAADADAFVAAILETFRWHSDAIVDAATYRRLNEAHRLIADVVCFKGPHINHLTPRVLDIDAAQAEMKRRGIDAKVVVEGPPRRAVPILLRQTSFKALVEAVRFIDQGEAGAGTHTARFGEIEQRGIALTPKGRALYDALLHEARGGAEAQGVDHDARLSAAFASFPDSEEALRQQGLAYFRYRPTVPEAPFGGAAHDLAALIDAGLVVAEPIIYEDFLPVSAAGIFQSNLGGEGRRVYAADLGQAGFEAALGTPVHDPFALYAAIEKASADAILTLFGRAPDS